MDIKLKMPIDVVLYTITDVVCKILIERIEQSKRKRRRVEGDTVSYSILKVLTISSFSVSLSCIKVSYGVYSRTAIKVVWLTAVATSQCVISTASKEVIFSTTTLQFVISTASMSFNASVASGYSIISIITVSQATGIGELDDIISTTTLCEFICLEDFVIS